MLVARPEPTRAPAMTRPFQHQIGPKTVHHEMLISPSSLRAARRVKHNREVYTTNLDALKS